jgi:uncharacterized repeat protein (TIGR03803 family)
MHSAVTKSGTKDRLDISDAGPRLGATKLAAIAIRGVLTLAVLAALPLVAAQMAKANSLIGENVLYNFCSAKNCADGGEPLAGLIQDTAGNLYGTTAAGGNSNSNCFGNCGTVFEVGNAGYKVLYSFCPGVTCTDGALPYSGLIQDAAGNLYGTTEFGGTNNTGTVFEIISPAQAGGTWTENVLWSFSPYVAGPSAMIQDVTGNLYGTLQGGGANIEGIAFELVRPVKGGEWTFNVLYNFCSSPNCTDGAQPDAGVIQDSAGYMYGTTQSGGAYSSGTVFKLAPPINPDGTLTETVLYNFCSAAKCADGDAPSAGLIEDAAGNFYGTTPQGGTPAGSAYESGVVFELGPPVNPDGTFTETVLHNFCSVVKKIGSCLDGAGPAASLTLDAAGDLYGATSTGGSAKLSGGGVVFELIPPVGSGGVWTENVLYDFCVEGGANCTDGNSPLGGVIQGAGGNLYGTTVSGGAYSSGVVFDLGGNGVDVSSYTESIENSSWQQAILGGIRFAVVQGWGGLTENLYAPSQVIGANANNIYTAAYALLNFQSNAGTGAQQVDNAVAAVGSAQLGELNFIAVDVEPCCGYGKGTIIPAQRLARIREAVDEIVNTYNKPAVIYTDRINWPAITGCGKGKPPIDCSDLTALPLWDVEHKHYTGADGKQHCGDGIIGLGSFTKYPNGGWTSRSGNQYDWGLYTPGADISTLLRSPMMGEDPLASTCSAETYFDMESVDLDFFLPTLFQ